MSDRHYSDRMADTPEPRKHPVLSALLVVVLGVLLVAVTVNQVAGALRILGLVSP